MVVRASALFPHPCRTPEAAASRQRRPQHGGSQADDSAGSFPRASSHSVWLAAGALLGEVCSIGGGGGWRALLEEAHNPGPTDRTRPELLPDDIQRQFLAEIQSAQEPEITRQLEVFRWGQGLEGLGGGQGAKLVPSDPPDPCS